MSHGGILMLEASADRMVNKIKVLYLLTNERSAGLVRGQLDHLSQNNFEVYVAAGTKNREAPVVFDQSAIATRLPFVRQPSIIRDPQALIATIRLIRRIRPDISNASTPKASVLGMIAAWLCRVPVRVLVVRGFRFETTTGFRRRYLKMFDQIAVKCATNVVFNSSSLCAFAI